MMVATNLLPTTELIGSFIAHGLTSTLIVVSFSVPLALTIRAQAKERALTFARSDARALAPVVSLAGSPNVTSSIYAVAQRALPRVVTVVFSDFTILGANEVVEPDPYDDPVALRRAQKRKAFTVPAKGGLVVYEPVPRSNNTTAVVRVWVPNAQLNRGVWRAWLVLALLGLGLVLLAGFVADRLGRSLVRSVNVLAESANRLGRGDVSERITPDGPSEIQQVGAALNNLAKRIDELLTTERVAVADLQHRLRTPVTALRAEVGTMRDPVMAPSAHRLEVGLEELTKTIDQIIRDAAQPMRRGIGIAIDFAAVVRDRFAFWEVLAEDQGREVALKISSTTPCQVAIVESDLTTIVDALLDNIFSHTEEGVGFEVTVSVVGNSVRLLVDDSGDGLPMDYKPTRGASSSGSTGLGLDIVGRIVESGGGSFTIRRRASGGTRAEVSLPLLNS
jgi:signal transduction histidine kinase